MIAERKTILLGMPVISNLHRLIEENLRFHHFEVIDTAKYNSSFRYPSLKSHLYAKWRKLIYKDKETRKDIMWGSVITDVQQKIQSVGGLDYALFISADCYSKDFLKEIKKQTRLQMVNYQFDGLHRYPAINDRIELFDRFYVFDEEDLAENPHFLPACNFYFDNNLDKIPRKNSVQFYFLGSHNKSRVNYINEFAQYAEKRQFKIDFSIFWKKSDREGRKIYLTDNIQLISKEIDFEKNTSKAMQANVLLDFVIGNHQGLSFRCFEALGYRKKLITSNQAIAGYDFYHPNNILIWDGKDYDSIDKFLNLPYIELASEVYEKYSFGNWIKYILNIHPHLPITLPSK